MTCQVNIDNSIYAFDPQSLLNPLFIEDENCPEPAISIKIRLGDDWHQFNCFYNPPSLMIEENRGFEKGKSTFRITDSNKYHENLPFIPIIGMSIEIWNLTENDLLFKGSIDDVERYTITRRCDGTDVSYFDITCGDKTNDFERIIFSARYTNVKLGFIIRDIIKRFTWFDETDIDSTLGQDVAEYRVNLKYPSQVIQELLQLEPSLTFWIDWENNKPQLTDITSPLSVNMYINNDNVFNYFDVDTFTLGLDNNLVKNVIIYKYNKSYSEGTVSLREGGILVSGQNTKWKSNVKAGAKIRFGNEDAEYSIREVTADNEIFLNEAYQGELYIETELDYLITGMTGTIQVEDIASINRMAAINRENNKPQIDGKYMMLVPRDSGTYSYNEAVSVANSYLESYKDPGVTGKGTSDNSKIPLRGLRAGQVIYFDLNISRGFDAYVVIQKLVKRDTGAKLCRIDTTAGEDRIDPLLIYEFDFQDRIYDLRNIIKKLSADVRRLDDSDETIEIINKSSESIDIYDCIDFSYPNYFENEIELTDNIILTSPLFSFSDTLEFEDNHEITNIPVGESYYIEPSSGNEAYTTGGGVYSFPN